MTNASEHTPLDRACLLVGRFLLHFSAIETELNEALRKLFELNPDSSDTVCANIEFFTKVNIVRSALTDQDADGARTKQIKDIFGRIAKINDHRVITAHAGFQANGTDGVQFIRTSAKTGLKREAPVWTEAYCAELFGHMEVLRTELHFMVQSIAPYYPSLDFSDPRNSGYIALLF
jgi:hypothetical protein